MAANHSSDYECIEGKRIYYLKSHLLVVAFIHGPTKNVIQSFTIGGWRGGQNG